jgi:hypothetical protein
MKRSEMLGNIVLVLEEFYGQDRYHKRVSESLLNKIEKAGMLPPLNEDWMSLDECREFYGPSWENDVSTYPRKNVHRWEPEDE